MRNDRGMTLVEVLVSLVIVFIVFLGLSSGGLLVLDQNIKNTQRDEAVSVAEEALQEVRNTPVPNVTDNTWYVNRTIRGASKRYDIFRTVTPLDTSNNNKEVLIDVRWTREEAGQTKTYDHQVRTIVRTR